MQKSEVETRVRESFDRQALMNTLGAKLDIVKDGEVHIRLPASEHITQQHGFAHAGAIASIADSACGYACYSKMEKDDAILSVEFKINLLARAAGESFLAIGKVIRSGRTISVASAEIFALVGNDAPKCIAVMQATMMRIVSKQGLNG